MDVRETEKDTHPEVQGTGARGTSKVLARRLMESVKLRASLASVEHLPPSALLRVVWFENFELRARACDIGR
jgi:hypothetical protein